MVYVESMTALKLTDAMFAEICKRLALGRSLRSICRDDDVQISSGLLRQHVLRKPDWAKQYAEARDMGLDEMAEEMLEIADDGSNDWMEKEMRDGRIETVLNHEHVQRSKLRKETRQWYLSKLAPKRYGEKLQTDVTSSDGSLKGYSRDEVSHKLQAILDAARKRQEAAAKETSDVEDLIEELV